MLKCSAIKISFDSNKEHILIIWNKECILKQMTYLIVQTKSFNESMKYEDTMI